MKGEKSQEQAATPPISKGQKSLMLCHLTKGQPSKERDYPALHHSKLGSTKPKRHTEVSFQGCSRVREEVLLGVLTLCGSSKKSLNLLGREYFFTNSSSTTQGAFSQVPARRALCRMKYLRISLLGGRSVRTKLSAGTLLMILEVTDMLLTFNFYPHCDYILHGSKGAKTIALLPVHKFFALPKLPC